MEKFVSSPEQDRALEEIIEKYRTVKGSLITVLQEAQHIYGWLPPEVIKKIADGMDMPVSDVAGAESFYSFFNNEPYGRHVIRMCSSAPCHIEGAQKTLEALCDALGIEVGGTTSDGRFSLLLCGCLGACDRSPAVLVGDELFGPVGPDDVPELLKKFD